MITGKEDKDAKKDNQTDDDNNLIFHHTSFCGKGYMGKMCR